MESPSGSKLKAWLISFPKSAKRNIFGGQRSAISLALLPRPFEEAIFLPPTRKNSYGISNGGSYPNTSRAIWLATSREPPFVEWSLPPPSISTPCATHFAAQSTFQKSFVVPFHGATRPLWPQGMHSSGERSHE